MIGRPVPGAVRQARGAGGRMCIRLALLVGLPACGDSGGPHVRPGVTSVAVTPGAATLPTFDSLRLAAVATDSRGDTLTDRPIQWLSSDTSRATVTPSGLVNTLRPGFTTIRAVVESASGQANITVTPSVLTVLVLAGDDSARAGENLQFTATLLGGSGNEVTGPAVTWSTTNAQVATVSTTGMVSARRPGTVSVTATAEGTVGARALRVMVPIESVTISPTSASVGPGVTFPFEVALWDSVGRVEGLVVAWASADTAVATIDTGGRLSARTPGNTSISATSERTAGQANAGVRTTSFTSIAPGDEHSCGVTTDQVVFCWGQNGGRLGDSAALPVNGPVQAVGDRRYVAMGSGIAHSCGLLVSGEAYCWGSNTYGQIGQTGVGATTFPLPVQGGLALHSLSVGYSHSCGLSPDSLAYCWGYGYHGQLGDGNGVSSSVPVPVSGGHRFARLSAGGAHTCGLTATGTAYCWGANEGGRLGDSTLAPRAVPTRVVGGGAFVTISAGGYHTCALDAAGAAYCWGYGGTGQIGINSAAENNVTPVAVHGGLTFSSITTGLYHTCAVTAAGAVYCWGYNSNGQSGPNAGPTVIGGQSLVPVPVGIDGSSVAAGTWHTCALTPNGAYCWGRNDNWQLGDGGRQDSAFPVRVLGQP